MCGRYELNATPAELRVEFGGLVPEHAWQAVGPISRYNIAPSQPCLVIRYSKRDEHNVIEPLQWGFRPQWAKRSWINARDDTLFDTQAFREAAQKRRCLVIATGWYEWRDTGAKRKQPYYIRYDRPFAFAGVWTARRLHEKDWELSFAIVTTDSRGPVAAIHDRMPLVLDPRRYEAWLNPRTENAAALLEPYAPPPATYPVSTAVNDPQHDAADCTTPLPPEQMLSGENG